MSRRRVSFARRAGFALLTAPLLCMVAGPLVAPHTAHEQFADRSYAPPARVHFFSESGLTAPYIHPLVLEDRVARRYREDTSVRIPLRWFHDGHIVSSGVATEPLMILGADVLGRDVFSRLVSGARLSLGVTLLGVIGAIAIGVAMGGLAGVSGGRTDGALMLIADFLLALPGAYLVLVLRGVLPPVLDTGQVFGLMALLFALAAWPHAARGVRSIIASERTRDYAEASRAAGAGRWRLARQLMPAATGFLVTEVILLIPALLIAESTVSYLGLGFADVEASWGTMMQDASNPYVMVDAPWVLAPAIAVFIVVLATQLVSWSRRHLPTLVTPSPEPY